MTLRVEKTERGFEIVRFLDLNGDACSLQQSSAALTTQPGAGAVWLGLGQDRMHLDQGQVWQLAMMLQQWLKTGSFNHHDCPACEHDAALVDGRCVTPNCLICGPEGAEDCDP